MILKNRRHTAVSGDLLKPSELQEKLFKIINFSVSSYLSCAGLSSLKVLELNRAKFFNVKEMVKYCNIAIIHIGHCENSIIFIGQCILLQQI